MDLTQVSQSLGEDFTGEVKTHMANRKLAFLAQNEKYETFYWLKLLRIDRVVGLSQSKQKLIVKEFH